VVHPEVGNNVDEESLEQTNLLTEVPDGRTHKQQTEIRNGNEMALRLGPQRPRGIKVAVGLEPARALALDWTALGSRGHIEKQVRLPPGELVREQADERVDGGVLEHLEPLGEVAGLARDVLLGPGNKRRVLFRVVCVAVVARVRDLPGEVGDEQDGVQRPADDIVDALVRGEGAVATLVGEDPDSGAGAALEEAVEDPGEDAQRQGREVVDLQGEVEEDSGVDEVADYVGAGDEEGAVEAVRGDGIADFLEGEFLLRCC
jgi:hypothetical protein